LHKIAWKCHHLLPLLLQNKSRFPDGSKHASTQEEENPSEKQQQQQQKTSKSIVLQMILTYRPTDEDDGGRRLSVEGNFFIFKMVD